MTQNALTAARWYVVTAIPDHLSTIGLNILQRKVKKIGEPLKSAGRFAGEEKPKRIAEMGGIIFVRVRLGGSVITGLHQGKMLDVNSEQLNGICFSDYTTELIGYGEAADAMLPVWMAPTQNAKKAATRGEYERITEEFVQRFN
jgi:chromosome partitioning protein